MIYAKNKRQYIAADQIELDDVIQVVVVDNVNSQIVDKKVNRIETSCMSKGFIAPLTDNGILLVNNVHVSCFAHVKSHTVSLFFLKPFILFYKLFKNFDSFSFRLKSIQFNQIHFYAKYLFDFAQFFTPFFLI